MRFVDEVVERARLDVDATKQLHGFVMVSVEVLLCSVHLTHLLDWQYQN